MLGLLAAVATAAAGIFGKPGGDAPIIPEHIEVEIDVWERNRTIFVLIFLMIALWAVVRL